MIIEEGAYEEVGLRLTPGRISGSLPILVYSPGESVEYHSAHRMSSGVDIFRGSHEVGHKVPYGVIPFDMRVFRD